MNSEQGIHIKHDPETGLHAIIAIDNTHNGPALGGCRFKEYSSIEEAKRDALRLARGMSLKAALAQLPFGGGKAVILKPQKPYDRTQLFKKFGQFINELSGSYITAMDSGSEVDDMDAISSHTTFVTCASHQSVSGNSDPAPLTALGVIKGIEAALYHRFQDPSLHGKIIAIQGLGHVGRHLAQLCFNKGAKLIVSDIDPTRVAECVDALGAIACEPKNLLTQACDILAPCALGGILNEHTIPTIQAWMIAGAANNQLQEEGDAERLFQKGILYLPDYLINAGGLILTTSQYLGHDYEWVLKKVGSIYHTTVHILQEADQKDTYPQTIANQIAMARLDY